MEEEAAAIETEEGGGSDEGSAGECAERVGVALVGERRLKRGCGEGGDDDSGEEGRKAPSSSPWETEREETAALMSYVGKGSQKLPSAPLERASNASRGATTKAAAAADIDGRGRERGSRGRDSGSEGRQYYG